MVISFLDLVCLSVLRWFWFIRRCKTTEVVFDYICLTSMCCLKRGVVVVSFCVHDQTCLGGRLLTFLANNGPFL